ARLQEFFVEQGVWIRPFAGLLYLMPPYVISKDDLNTLTTALVAAAGLP
ncbi:Adenosylmethionine-8-amino-7-oxononanoate aminotransferase, partial [hydrothermal vent metagenome]